MDWVIWLHHSEINIILILKYIFFNPSLLIKLLVVYTLEQPEITCNQNEICVKENYKQIGCGIFMIDVLIATDCYNLSYLKNHTLDFISNKDAIKILKTGF